MPIVFSDLYGDGSKIDINEIYPKPLSIQYFYGTAPTNFDEIAKQGYENIPDNTPFLAIVNRSGGFMLAIGLKTNHLYGFFLLIGYQSSNIAHYRLYGGTWTSRSI